MNIFSKTTIYFLIVFLLVLFIGLFIAYKRNQNFSPELTSVQISDKESLDLEKQKLEIIKLKDEINSISISPILQAGTLSAALIAAAISFWSAWRSQKNQLLVLKTQIQQQQSNHISGLLKELGSKEISVKLAAIYALSEYESAVPFLVNILRVDNDTRICSAVNTALLQLPEAALNNLVEVNRTLVRQYNDLAGKFIAFGYSQDEVLALFLTLDRDFFINFLKSSQFSKINSMHQTKQKAEINLKVNKETDSIDGKNKLFEEYELLVTSIENINNAIERVIEKASLLNKPFDLSGTLLNGLVLNNLNLSEWQFTYCNLRSVHLNKTICRETDFSNSIIKHGNFYEANFEKAKFDNSKLERINFGKSVSSYISIKNSECINIRFNGSTIKSALFDGSKLVQGHFNGVSLSKSSFKKSNLFRVDFSGSNLSGVDFSQSFFAGSLLKSVKAFGAKFNESRFQGINFCKGKFDNADFSLANFESIENFENSSFMNIKINDAIFSDKTKSFKFYLKPTQAD